MSASRGNCKHEVVSVTALCLMLFLVAFALTACGRQPSLSLDEIREVRFTDLFSGKSWPASEAEVRLLVEFYSEAENLNDDFGTTPPARIDIVVKSGENLVVWGGGETYQTVCKGDREYNIESSGLHQMLQEIVARGQR